MSVNYVFVLCRYFCEKEIEVTESKLMEAQRQMMRMAPWVPKNDTLTWPLGKNIFAVEGKGLPIIKLMLEAARLVV